MPWDIRRGTPAGPDGARLRYPCAGRACGHCGCPSGISDSRDARVDRKTKTTTRNAFRPLARPESKRDDRPGSALDRLLVAPLDLVPVDHVVERGDVVGAAVLVLEVIGVFPDVEAEDRRVAGTHALHQRIV